MEEEPYLDSAKLAELRQFVETYPSLEGTLGKIAEFKVVIDANIAIQDLLHKYQNPHHGQTAIEETFKSSTLKLYAPRWLDTEMVSSTIPQVAAKKKVPEETLIALWADYKEQIIFDETLATPDDASVESGDPKDAPYVELKKSVQAAAILSKDKGFNRMGENTVSLQFIFSLREYSRSATHAVSLKVNGTVVSFIGFGAVRALFSGLANLWGRIPDGARIALIVVAVLLVANPKSREWLMDRLRDIGDLFLEGWPYIEELINEATEKQKLADEALAETEKLLIANTPVQKTT